MVTDVVTDVVTDGLVMIIKQYNHDYIPLRTESFDEYKLLISQRIMNLVYLTVYGVGK